MKPDDKTVEQLQLADIHLPTGVADWPPAYGWWVLLAVLIILFLLGLRYQLKRRQQKQQQKALLEHIDHWEKKLKQGQGVSALAGLNTLLKRIALQYYPRQQVAHLSGQQWLAFLDKSVGMTSFVKGDGKLLETLPYQADMARDKRLAGLMVAVRQWTKLTLKQSWRQK